MVTGVFGAASLTPPPAALGAAANLRTAAETQTPGEKKAFPHIAPPIGEPTRTFGVCRRRASRSRTRRRDGLAGWSQGRRGGTGGGAGWNVVPLQLQEVRVCGLRRTPAHLQGRGVGPDQLHPGRRHWTL